MIKNLKQISKIFRNCIIILILLELFLTLVYNYIDENEYEDYIDLKISNNVHNDMSSEDIKNMYKEYKQLEMEWAPFVHYKPKKFQGKYNTINDKSQRFTFNPFTNVNKEPVKVFLFGGSTMYGIGSDDNHSIPSELSKQLYRNFPTEYFQITNFGVLGYNRDLEINQLHNEILNNNIPDIAIFYDGVNEVYAAHQYGKVRYPLNSYNRFVEFNTAINYKKRISLFFKKTYTNRALNYIRKKISPKPIIEDKSFLSKKIASNYSENIRITRALAKEYNFKVLNFLQPTIFVKNPLSEFEVIMKENEDYLRAIYEKTYKNISLDTILNQDSTFVNISNLFNSYNTTIFTDFCHTNEVGNKIIAEEISKHLSKYLNY